MEKIHDFTKTYWGSSVNLTKTGNGVYYIIGRSDERIQKGDFLSIRFAFGENRLIRVDSIKYFADPTDMFDGWASVGEWSMTDEERRATIGKDQ